MKLFKRLNTTIGISDMRQHLCRYLHIVAKARQALIITKYGTPIAAVVPLTVYTWWKTERHQLIELMQKGANRANLDEDTAMRLALEIQAEVRASRKKTSEKY